MLVLYLLLLFLILLIASFSFSFLLLSGFTLDCLFCCLFLLFCVFVWVHSPLFYQVTSVPLIIPHCISTSIRLNRSSLGSWPVFLQPVTDCEPRYLLCVSCESSTECQKSCLTGRSNLPRGYGVLLYLTAVSSLYVGWAKLGNCDF